MESNDSPEIPDRGETSDIPGLPSGVVSIENMLLLSTVAFNQSSSLGMKKITLIVSNIYNCNFYSHQFMHCTNNCDGSLADMV